MPELLALSGYNVPWRGCWPVTCVASRQNRFAAIKPPRISRILWVPRRNIAGQRVCLVVNHCSSVRSFPLGGWMLCFPLLCLIPHPLQGEGRAQVWKGGKKRPYFGVLLNRLRRFHGSMRVQPSSTREANAVYRQRRHGPRQLQLYLPHSQKVKVQTGWEIIYRALSATAAAAWLMICRLCPFYKKHIVAGLHIEKDPKKKNKNKNLKIRFSLLARS